MSVANLDDAYQAAVKNNDVAGMHSILAPDFVLVAGKGTVYTKKQFLDAARTREVTYERQEDTQRTVRMYGANTAVATALLWEKGVQKGTAFDKKLWLSDVYVSFLVPTIAACLLAAAPAEACSKIRFSSYRMPGNEALIAVSTTDTVIVSPSGALPRAFGMIARVERLGARSRLGNATTVVLVPWDYGADCKPARWTRSAAWVPGGTRGLYIGTLRASSEWIGGRPTIDVHFPYAHGFPYTDAKPSAHDMLTMYDLLPEPPRDRTDTARINASFVPLLRWARDNPKTANNRIVTDLLREARWQVGSARVESIDSPIAGTYHFVVTVSGRDSISFFAASERRPISTLQGAERRAPQTYDAQGIPISAGYYIYTEVGSSAADARRAPKGERERDLRGGYLAAMIQPTVSNADSTVWRGSADLFQAAAVLASNSSQKDFLLALSGEYADSATSYVPGRFVRHRDGRTTFDATYTLPGRPTVMVRGVRVSTDVLPTLR